MSKVDLIIALGKCMCESQRIIAAIKSVTLAFEAVLVVGYVASNTMPAQLLGTIARKLRKAEHTHTFVVE